MQIKALLLTPLVAAGVVSAAPKASTPKSTFFNALVLRSATPIHFSSIQASKESFALKLKDQGATCDDQKKHNDVTFHLVGDELWLYSIGNPGQQAYVDFSGMGQGKFGYTTGAQPMTRNGQRNGWKIDKDGFLTNGGSNFVACPNSKNLEKASWSVWVYNSIDNPGGNKNCIPFTVKAVDVKKPVGCMYSAIQPAE